MEMEERMAALEQRVADLEVLLAQLQDKLDRPVAQLTSDDIKQAMTGASPEEPLKTYYLAAPTQEGVFADFAEREEAGKSIYQLTTKDGHNGTFSMLDTPDAVATATISVSQFVKPACKIMGNSRLMPRRIYTVEDGKATRDDNGWKVLRKAVVAFEN